MTRLVTWGRRPWVLVAALAIPMIVAWAVTRSPQWFPSSDLAQAELHVRAVPRHMPLVGAAGRIGTIFEQGSHPGPAGALALSLPYRILGSNSSALMGATVVLHLVAIVTALLICRRVAGVRAMAILAALVALTVRSFGADWFLEPWNPWFGVFPFMVLLVAVWAVWLGDDAMLPIAAVAGSFCAQVHVSYVPIVAVLALALTGRLFLQRRRGDGPARRHVVWSLVISIVMWLPPIIDQMTRTPGNLTILWRHFTDPPDAPAGWRATLSAFVNEFNLLGSCSAGVNNDPSASPNLVHWSGFAGLLLLSTAAIRTARRRKDATSIAAWQVLGVVTVTSLITVTRIFGPVSEYLVRWISSLAVVTIAIALWTLLGRLPAQRWTTLLVPIFGTAAVAALIASLFAPMPVPQRRDSLTLAALTPDTLDATTDDVSYLIRFHDPVALGGLGNGLLLEMERHGRHVGADAWLRANVLPHRVMSESEADAIVWVVTGDPSIADTSALPGARIIARTDPRSADDVARSDALRQDIEAALVDIGRADLVPRLDEQYGVSQVMVELDSSPEASSELMADLEEYRDLRLPTAVIIVPVGTAA